MKIGFISDGTYVAGAEIVNRLLTSAMISRGHEVHVAVSGWSDGRQSDWLRRAGATVHSLRLGKLCAPRSLKTAWWLLDGLLWYPVGLFQAWRFRRQRFDAIVVDNFEKALLVAFLVPWNRCVVHVHSFEPGHFFSRWLLRVTRERRIRLIAISEHMRKRLIEAGAPADLVRLVYNGLETPVGETGRRSVDRKTIHVGIVGQIAEWKGHEDLLRAVALARDTNPALDLRLEVFGQCQSDYRRRLESLADQLGCSAAIAWRGFTEELAEIYGGLDICVVPSRHEEPFGMVAIEASSWSLPVIATASGALPEIVEDGETGFVVPIGSVSQLAERISELATDPEKRRRMGTAGRKRVEDRFSLGRTVEQFEKMFQELGDGKSAA